MRRGLCGVGLAIISAAAFSLPAFAGTIVGHSTANLWGRQMAYTTWGVDGDGVAANASWESPTDLVVYKGKLFVANNTGARYAPGYACASGAAGDLSTPLGKPSTGLTSNLDYFAPIRTLAINTSGSGLGAFSGNEPTLVGFGRYSSDAKDDAYVYRDQGAAYATTKATTNYVPRAVDFVPSLGKFATIARVTTFGTNRVSFWSHDASGLSASPDRFFEFDGLGTGVDSYGISMSVISGSLASFLTGVSISQSEVLLVAGSPRGTYGWPEDLTLAVFDLDGNRLGSGIEVPNIGVDYVKAIAVDEQNGLLYVGGHTEGGGGSISVISIPSPGTILPLMLASAVLTRRLRPNPQRPA